MSLMQYSVIRIQDRGVKHMAWGPELAQKRLQFGPLFVFGNCEKVLTVAS